MQAGALFRPFCGARVWGGDFHPCLCRQFLHRVHKGHAALIGQPADRIAMGLAAEAVIKPLLIIDVEAGGLLIMERATRLELTPRLGQPHRAPDYGRQRGPHPQFVEPLR